jgi:hypothetical protein
MTGQIQRPNANLCFVQAIGFAREKIGARVRHSCAFFRRPAMWHSAGIIEKGWATGFLHDRNP